MFYLAFAMVEDLGANRANAALFFLFVSFFSGLSLIVFHVRFLATLISDYIGNYFCWRHSRKLQPTSHSLVRHESATTVIRNGSRTMHCSITIYTVSMKYVVNFVIVEFL